MKCMTEIVPDMLQSGDSALMKLLPAPDWKLALLLVAHGADLFAAHSQVAKERQLAAVTFLLPKISSLASHL